MKMDMWVSGCGQYCACWEYMLRVVRLLHHTGDERARSWVYFKQRATSLNDTGFAYLMFVLLQIVHHVVLIAVFIQVSDIWASSSHQSIVANHVAASQQPIHTIVVVLAPDLQVITTRPYNTRTISIMRIYIFRIHGSWTSTRASTTETHGTRVDHKTGGLHNELEASQPSRTSTRSSCGLNNVFSTAGLPRKSTRLISTVLWKAKIQTLVFTTDPLQITDGVL